MVRGVSLVSGAVFGAVLLMLLGASFAQSAQCTVDSVSPQEYRSFLDSIYSEKGLVTLGKVGPAQNPEVESIDRDRTAVVVPEAGIYYSTEFNSTKAAKWDDPRNPYKDMVVEGPFMIVGVLDDTLRVSLDSSAGYGNGKLLRERFEGRLERYGIDESLRAIKDEASLFMSALTNKVGRNSPVSNVIAGSDFNVSVTCGSTSCHQETYSLFQKYLNIGASAQMLFEFVGGALYSRVVPKNIKARINRNMTKLKAKAASYWSGADSLDKYILDNFSSQADDTTKTLLKGGTVDKTAYPGILENGFSPARFKQLPLEQQRLVLEYASYLDGLGTRLDDILAQCRKIPEACEKGGKYYEDLTGALKGIKEALSSVGMDDTTLGSLDSVLEELDKEGVDALLRNNVLSEKLPVLTRNARLLNQELSSSLPAASTVAQFIKEQAETLPAPGATAAGRKLVTGMTYAPLEYYVVKRAMMFGAAENPFFEQGGKTPAFDFLTGRGYPIPDSWKIGVLRPAGGGSSTEYLDAFVDIIINDGSDPGDAFKSFLNLTGFPLIVRAVSKATGHDTSMMGLLLSEEMDKAYSTGPAIALVATPSTCASCGVRAGDRYLNLTGNGYELYGSVVEDSNAEEEGSTAIVFGHHTDIIFEDAEIDIDGAKREGKSCFDTCALLKLPYVQKLSSKGAPGTAMFIASQVQSLATVLGGGWISIGIMGAAGYFAMSGCGDCIDTEGGYYVHMRVPPKKDTEAPVLTGPPADLTKALDSVGAVFGKVSDDLKEKVLEFKRKAEAEAALNSGAYVTFSVDDFSYGRLRIVKLIEAIYKSDKMTPSKISNEGSVKGESEDGRAVLLDKGAGQLAVDGVPVVSNPDLVRLSYFDYSIPALVTPAYFVRTAFSTSPAITGDTRGYEVLDGEFLACISGYFHIPASSQAFRELFGPIRLIRTDSADISFGDGKIAASTSDGDVWQVLSFNVNGKGDNYGVSAEVTYADITQEGNEVDMSTETEEHEFGSLESIVFENGAVYRDGDSLLVVVHRLASFTNNYVSGASLDTNGENFIPQFTPSPDAPKDVVDEIKRLNDLIREMGGVHTIVAQNGAVALVRDEQGRLWLRIFDRNAMSAYSLDDVRSIIRSVLDGTGDYDRVETLDGSFVLARARESVVLEYLDRASGSKKSEAVSGYSIDENGAFAIRTDARTHKVEVRAEGGYYVIYMDGANYGPVALPGAVEQHLVQDILRDPNDPNTLIVKTPNGDYRVTVGLDDQGNPYLAINDVIKGIVQLMQGPRGAVAYDPTTGTFSFLAGLLTPLSEAFKSGIKISVDASGNMGATPYRYDFTVRRNPYAQKQGLTLPFFDGWELIALILAIAAIYGINL